ncbi:MAG TPA: hypothetical protein DCY79_03870 [Planctomycetaceae bacterium]|nr:hypothetical protein [Blastopirellula sp.]HAY78921.1 hypothetical protein [Planctomycetaceae bacterium]
MKDVAHALKNVEVFGLRHGREFIFSSRQNVPYRFVALGDRMRPVFQIEEDAFGIDASVS